MRELKGAIVGASLFTIAWHCTPATAAGELIRHQRGAQSY